MLRVIIIEQSPILRLGIKYYFEKEFNDLYLTDFATLQECKSGQCSKKTDLIFIGIDEDSNEPAKLDQVKKLYPESRLIVFDPEANAETGIKYLRSGAHGYLSKRSNSTMLGNCVQTVLDGKFYIDPAYLEILVMGLKANNKAFRKQIHYHDFSLSQRQHEIALLLAQGRTTSEIAIKLGLQASTVSAAKSCIYTKLNVNNIIRLKEVLGVSA